MKLNKRAIAIRQLDTSIRQLFNAGDVVSVHTLASAAAAIFRDLLLASGEATWREAIIDGYPGGEKKAVYLLQQAQNFFKHADRDPNEEIEFNENTNDETIIVATLEYGQLIKGEEIKMSAPTSMYQMWYFAKDPRLLEMAESAQAKEIIKKAHALFPKINELPRFQQLAIGSEALRDWES